MTRHISSRRRFLQGSALAVAAAAGTTITHAPSALAGPVPAAPPSLPNEDGYELWLRYRPPSAPRRRQEYRTALTSLALIGDSPVLANAEAELHRALEAITGTAAIRAKPAEASVLLARLGADDSEATSTSGDPSAAEIAEAVAALRADTDAELQAVGPEGFVLLERPRVHATPQYLVVSTTERGVLYGTFALIRHLQLGHPLEGLSVAESPAVPMRMLNHWDNRDGSIERGYAGESIFDWDALPEVPDRVTDYARAMASIGLNAAVINNVNASADFLTPEMLEALAPLATTLASWGISIWLSVNYASPMDLTAGDADPIDTADPADERVQHWWESKATEMVEQLEGLGGILVKANSEGQPGPLDYGRTHAEGANMLARAFAPHDRTVIWRSFVHEDFGDWAEFQDRIFAPLDGDFDANVIVQTKNGPIDFQIREPVHPLFGTLQNTHQMLELQITQEYTGQSTHTCYLAPLWSEVLSFPTQGPGTGPTVAEIMAGGPLDTGRAGIAGVSNIGDDTDWTGYQLGAANAHAFGRLCWTPTADPQDLAEEWVALTFGTDETVTTTLAGILVDSRGTYEDYTSPLGMGYLSNPGGDHYGPNPLSTLFQSHHTTGKATGYDRTVATGTGFTGLYPEGWSSLYESLDTCPEELLLFLHQVPYEHRLASGSTLIQHIYDTHFEGAQNAAAFRDQWQTLTGSVDDARHDDVAASFEAQLAHAQVWRDAIVAFFFEHSRIADEQREWIRAQPANPAVLLGGQVNLLPVEVLHASATSREVAVALAPPGDDWEVTDGTATLEAADIVEVELEVAPPLAATTVSAQLAVTPELQRLAAQDANFVVAPSGSRCTVALNAGPVGGTGSAGYMALTPESLWSDGAVAGWVGSGPQARDRTGDVLIRDHVYDSSTRTLRLAVPAGKHTGLALIGDTGAAASATTISVDGTQVAASPKLDASTFSWLEIPLDGGAEGRTADLSFSGDGGPWRLTALTLPDPEAPAPTLLSLAATSAEVWWLDRANEIAVRVRNTGDTAREITARASIPDGWTAEEVTASLAPGSEQELIVTVTPTGEPGTGTVGLDLHEGEQLLESGRTATALTVPHGDDVLLALDAGPADIPVLDSYDHLGRDSTFDEDRGAGWTGTPPDARDRGNTDVLRRDYLTHKGEPSRLQIAVPAGIHTLSILSGDSATDSGVTIVSESGAERGRSGTEGRPSRSFVWFPVELDGGADGRVAELEITGDPEFSYGLWRISALILR